MLFSAFAFSGCGTPSNQTVLDPPLDVVETDYFTFKYNKSAGAYSVKTTEAGAQQEKLTIPGKINGYKVTTVEDYCFIRNDKLKEVVLESGITIIGMSAFSSCSSLSSVTLPDSLIAVKKSAFSDCTSISRIVLSDNLRTLEEGCFSGCKSLSQINLPQQLVTIPSNLLSGTAIESVTIPESVKKIGASAFSTCTSLSEVKLNKNLTEIAASAFAGCTSLTEILFPRNENLHIGDYAFSGSGLTKVYIPENVTLGTYTFMKLAWDDKATNPGDPSSPGASACTAIYYESAEGSRGVNVFGYTWNRPDLGFRIYVPQGSLDYYKSANPGDESWLRCVVNSVNSVDGTYSVLEEYDVNEVFPDGFPVAQ